MNNRFTLQDLAGILANQTGRTKKESEEFLREFISVVSDGAFTDRIVKIKGLGTFKVIEVEDRESVNVNTGKRFIIPGHYKFNFTPDKDLKELVNKPFSFFDTTEINTEDSLQELTATTKEQIETIEDDDNQEKEIDIKPIDSPIEETVAEVVEVRLEEDIQPDNENEELIDDDLQEIKNVEEKQELTPEPDLPNPSIPVDNEPQQRNEDRVKDGTVQQKRNKLLLTIILILLVAAVGLFAYLFLKPEQNPKFSTHIENTIKEPIQETQDIVEEPDVTVVKEEDQSLVETETSKSDQTIPAGNSNSTKVLAHITIEPGSRLTLIALDYYQHKVFWVYIYEFNKELIEDPNNIPVGTKLAIPAPEVYGINVNDRESIEKASLLQTQIIAGER